MELPWLKNLAEDWLAREERGRKPHAVLLEGPAGVGKRSAAAWMAGRHLGCGAAAPLPGHPAAPPQHADFRWLRPADDKQAIGIEAVRELVADLALTSYAGGGKAAVIEPADAMTVNAANSLLKTLEEPPGDALLILVSDRAGRLPATIVSRCQRIAIGLPPPSASLEWLDRVKRSGHWAAALREAGYAPLAALQAVERLDETAVMAREFAGLPARAFSPIDTAARWSKHDAQFVLGWLGREVQDRIRHAAGSADSVDPRMDSRKLFCYLDTINRIRHQPAGSYNLQLTVESLLIDWAEGLRDCRPLHSPDNFRLAPGA